MNYLENRLDTFFTEYKIAIEPFGFILQYDMEKILKDYKNRGLFKSLNLHSNISNGFQPSSHFNFFFDAPQTNKKFYIFGTDHGPCDYAINKESSVIAIIEVITGNFFFNIAKDEISFLQVLTKMIEFENYYAKGIHVDGNMTRKTREECIKLAGGEDYAKLYRHIIISEEDMPTDPFTLP
jgi:hypothetical protein